MIVRDYCPVRFFMPSVDECRKTLLRMELVLKRNNVAVNLTSGTEPNQKDRSRKKHLGGNTHSHRQWIVLWRTETLGCEYLWPRLIVRCTMKLLKDQSYSHLALLKPYRTEARDSQALAELNRVVGFSATTGATSSYTAMNDTVTDSIGLKISSFFGHVARFRETRPKLKLCWCQHISRKVEKGSNFVVIAVFN